MWGFSPGDRETSSFAKICYQNGRFNQSLVPSSKSAVLITGATCGIGLSIARALAIEGCNLILTGRDESALSRVRRELESKKIQIIARPCDVRDPQSVSDLFRAVRGQFKRLDILVNNAGIPMPISESIRWLGLV